MIAPTLRQETKRLTTTEEVFRRLKDEIISLQLPPGSKISEVEVAKACDVSRQPVREAFMRLGDLNLVEIRPQRATRVCKISHDELRNTRFIRAAVEVEVVRQACKMATPEHLSMIETNIRDQQVAVDSGDADALKTLDYRFHNLICVAAGQLPAFKIIAQNKTHTDRVCTLELSDAEGMNEVIEGHTDIFNAVRDGDEERAVEKTRIHLRHLDATLVSASENYPDFFED
ncbi:MAG: GntR family transcriptional regulator [Roseobacter sp.]